MVGAIHLLLILSITAQFPTYAGDTPEFPVQLIVDAPSCSRNAVYGNSVNFRILLKPTLAEYEFDQNSKLCFSHLDPIHRSTSAAAEVCSSGSDFEVHQFKSGTFAPYIYLKTPVERSVPSTHDDGFRIDGMVRVPAFDVVEHYFISEIVNLRDPFFRSTPSWQQQQYAVTSDSPQLLDGDWSFAHMLYYPEKKTTGDVSNASSKFEVKLLGLDVHRRHRSEHPSRTIALFVDLTTASTSNRLRDWVKNHDLFHQHNYTLIIIGAQSSNYTADDNDYLGDDLADDLGTMKRLFGFQNDEISSGICTIRFSCLSMEAAEQMIREFDGLAVSTEFLRRSYSQLVRVMQNLIDVVILENTYGDAASTLLMMACKDGARGPLVAMDLPNMVVPSYWHDLIDVVVAPSRHTGMHSVTAGLGKPVAIIHPPMRDTLLSRSNCILDGSSFDGTVTKSKYEFIYVGRLDSDKSPGLLVRSIAYILNGGESEWCTSSLPSLPRTASPQFRLSKAELENFREHVHFTFYGDGLLKAALQQLVQDLQIDDHITFAGHQSYGDIVESIKNADTLINPIIVGETFGFIHLEAAAHAVPVIAFRAAANVETVQSGILIDYAFGSVVEDLADAIMLNFQVRHDPDAFSRRSTCEKFNRIAEYWNASEHSHVLMEIVEEFLELRSKRSHGSISNIVRV